MRTMLRACTVVGLLLGACGGGSGSEQSAQGPVAGAGGAAPTAGTGGAAPTAGAGPAAGTSGGDMPLEPGRNVEVVGRRVPLELQAELDAAAALDAAGLAARHAVRFAESLGYDPLAATGLDLVQASNLRLTEPERQLLADQGFVITRSNEFPTFFYAYLTIYGEDLPVYVSADSVLDALHRSYVDILADIERGVLVPQLRALLSGMRGRIAAAQNLDAQVLSDLEFYLAVAHSLLDGGVPESLSAGVNPEAVRAFYDAGLAASGIQVRELFGVMRHIDFSQLKPRGHYEGDPVLEPYFRAMMWLGRIDFRMLETQSDGSQVFRRRQVEASLGLREIMGEAELAAWRNIDAAVSAFVGEHDYMILPELDRLLADVGASGLAALSHVTDEQIVRAIEQGDYGQQRIASHVISKGAGSSGTLPLNVSFALLGQRYTVDSHVFSNVVFDRAGGGTVGRWLPDPLDAAFAALGNDHAVSLLERELATHAYAPDLAAMRALVDAHPTEYWESSLYTLWLDALRALSPHDDAAPEASGLPAVARTEPWGRRVLNTQLGSWSQLRHDTLLYTKQSYTVGTVCEFPDAYVDPYPELFGKIGRYAERGADLVAQLEFPTAEGSYLRDSLQQYFESLGTIAGILEEMARHQRTGLPHSAAHLAFINEVVTSRGGGSGPPSVEGWYARLFYNRNPLRALEYDPIIADVHTDVGGVERPPSVLHVATGRPRLMVVTVDTCEGPRAYAGPVFAYHELRPTGLTRYTDSEWARRLEAAPEADVPWMEPVLSH
jgi:hypothetical protein